MRWPEGQTTVVVVVVVVVVFVVFVPVVPVPLRCMEVGAL
jgi:hypothetical protein